MKKIILLATIALFGTGVIKAIPVDVTVAQKVAQNFFSSNHSGNKPVLTLAYTERDADGTPVYYVFNVTAPTVGFIIITADDQAHPIIGYSDEGNFVIPEANNNVDFWLQSRKKEIIAMRLQNGYYAFTNAAITDEWSAYSTGNELKKATHSVAGSSVSPLVQTAWNQSPFYNEYCPGGSVTGCVATAMAQILKYWAYPSVGIGSNCYDDEMSQGFSENYGNLCAYFDTSHYIWSEMPDHLGKNTPQVGKLMYDCGVSVDMDYTPTGSGAEVIGGWGPNAYNSYTQYFGYDASTINSAMYSQYTEANWITLLETELNSHRPMQFEGTDPSEGGHSWVCDGYDINNNVHMNWGWGGLNDGYFAVNSLTPDGFDFSQQIGVIYGIQPPPGAEGVKEISNNTSVSVYPNPSNGVFNFVMPNNNSAYQIKVYNMLGEEINASTITSGKGEINISTQSKGVYIYKALSETGELLSSGRLVVE